MVLNDTKNAKLLPILACTANGPFLNWIWRYFTKQHMEMVVIKRGHYYTSMLH